MTPALRVEAERIVRRLREAGHEACFAGGCVRDMLRGETPADIDIATSARPEEIQRLFENTIAVGAQFGVVIVHTDAADYEVATFRTESAYSDGRHPDHVAFATAREDVLRRDFTINGMLYDPVADEILDWVGGEADLKGRTVRTIGDPDRRFDEDKLRLLRAVRFAARLEYAIEEETYAAMVRHAPELVAVSAERVRDELVRIFTGHHAGRALRLLHDTGLLKPVLPEIEAMVGVEQPPQFHPEGDVFEHTCQMFDHAENPSSELAMGILLHDVGKPGTQRFEERIRFDEHDRAGEELAGHICRRLRFSSGQIRHIVSLVGNHMRFSMAKRMKLSKLKALLALPRFEEHLELHRLDCVASHGKLDIYNFVLDKMEEFGEEEISPAPLVTGHDLRDLGYPEGPQIGRILAAVREEQLEGRVETREAALEWVRRRGSPEENDRSD